ncbi:MAG: DUF2238 domain-containing protein [Proteobacteria bacterium]|nr:DUF2238 domain-containing protein [Pseudomonadota bacterium]MBU4278246.1 DUF2238 domain-containing protein [Pseudomonadota bacterium]MBU4381637.1 DUF2238 domain-containing protein [Pseudomonadota bacterium]MBU4604468.1 DUF2238 domain-containing protein [Pseudomonadota bacterium]MCG2766624.1 DUF2238 domain-containing protein [Desulfarculaceae bacterium]
MDKTDKLNLFYLLSFLALLLWSGIKPYDRFTWFLEVLPALMGLAALALTYGRFRLTRLVYLLIWLHAIVLLVGGHYTYARVPLFDWLSQALDLGRNNYDKLGHLAQGFIPAMVTREVLLRNRVVTRRGWLAFLVVCVCLAVSAFYELIEWWTAALTGAAAEDFLGTQGYVWDTQSDMALCLLGSLLALAFLSRLHDRQMAALP